MGYPNNGYQVPGGGAPDGGRSAAYASWMQQGYGQQSPGYQQGYHQGYQGSSFSRPQKGKGFDKGKGKGKGKGYSKGGLFTAADAAAVESGLWTPWTGGGDDPRRAIEAAQRRAKQREKGGIAQAQKSAMHRFENDLLKRIQGRWVDGSDASTTYVVEENLCTVSGGENNRDKRVFRNRLSVINGELCWDARRFWHNLNLSSLPPLEEDVEVERVEWTPGEGSPPSNTIVWLRTAPEQKETESGEDLSRLPFEEREQDSQDLTAQAETATELVN